MSLANTQKGGIMMVRFIDNRSGHEAILDIARGVWSVAFGSNVVKRRVDGDVDCFMLMVGAFNWLTDAPEVATEDLN